MTEQVAFYRIINKIGAGGMGEVYLAEDTRLGRHVALKFLPASFQYDPERRERFLREARAASALHSPNIAAIYDIGEHDGAQFIAMEYVEGELLSRKVESGALDLLEALSITLQIAEALDDAHASGIVHRDIKSSNIIVTERGLVKVLDFGLAKIIHPHQEEDKERTLMFGKETSPGAVLGTAAYMSPEQARGLIVDHRSDLFSLGVVLYELVTGRKPFVGDTPSDMLVAILDKEPAPISHLAPTVPAQLDFIVRKALRKAAHERYQSARELAVDLRNLKEALELNFKAGRTVSLAMDSGEIKSDTGHLDSPTQLLKDDSSSHSGVSSQRKRRSRKAINSLAILPLINASTDPEMEYLSDGITEVLINNLSRMPKLRVMARSTTFRYKGQEVDPIRVGNELGVRAVLTGRVRQISNNLIIGTELVDVSDGAQLWGEQYNRKSSDIFALQEEISNEILETLRLKLGVKEKKPAINCCTDSVEAYDLYLKGRFHWNQWTKEGFIRSISLFKQAIEKDSRFALAYSGISDAYGALWFFNFMSGDEAIQPAKEAALKALALDDSLAEAHHSLANMKLFYEWDWVTSGREYKRALELNPNYANAWHMYAFYLCSLGRFDDAVASARRAAELDPLSPVIHNAVAAALTVAERYDESLEQMQKVIDAGFAIPMTYELAGTLYARKGFEGRGVEFILTALSALSNDEEIKKSLRNAFAESGYKGFWRRWLELAVDEQKIPIPSKFHIASRYAFIGDAERAFEWLEKAYEERAGFLIHLKVEPNFASLRNDPRFHDLVRRVGIPDNN
jgi:serine/threonine-protein kinase